MGSLKNILKQGYETKPKRKGRRTKGAFLGFGRPSRETRLRKIMGARVETSETMRKARLQSAKAMLEEQKARTRIAKRAGRGGGRRSFKPFGGRVSRRIGMRLI